MPYKNYIYEYYAKISSGEIIVGKWIKKIFEIIINGLQTQEYFFNAKAANKAIKFIETFCHHSKGRNDLITLELWQKAIVSTIFGIQDAEKIRVFREIFIVIGRKNGKSLFASALIAYMAYLEPEYGQEIYTDKVADGSLEKEIEEKVLFDVDYIKYQDTMQFFTKRIKRS